MGLKSAYYDGVALALDGSANFIEGQAQGIEDDISAIETNCYSDALSGDTYDKYLDKAEIVLGHLRHERDEFYSAVAQIRQCAQNARGKASYWRGVEKAAAEKVVETIVDTAEDIFGF